MFKTGCFLGLYLLINLLDVSFHLTNPWCGSLFTIFRWKVCRRSTQTTRSPPGSLWKEETPSNLWTFKIFEFCSLAGAANICNFILSWMTSSRHSEERTLLNQRRTVVILYQLCFGYSQKCNFFQEDNGLFLKVGNLSQSGIKTQWQLGTSVASKVISRNRAAIAKQNF